MKDNPNIEELLNGFIDGELTDRNRVEVQRLIAHDPQIARRLRDLEKCRMLLGALPRVETPAYLFERIKAAAERRTVIRVAPSASERRWGAVQLFARRLVAAAAMIALVGVLAAVVYTIVTPADRPQSPPGGSPVKPVAATAPLQNVLSTEFYGKLELRAAGLVRVQDSIQRAIEDNGLAEYVDPTSGSEKGIFELSCDRNALRLLLADLGDIWENLDSATLVVETDRFGRQVVVEAVTVDQINEIVGMDDIQERIRVARDFAVLNNMTQLVPGRELMVAIENTGPDLLITKPRLTGPDGARRPVAKDDAVNVHLTIALLGGK